MNMKRVLGICVLCVSAFLTTNAQNNGFEKAYNAFRQQAIKEYEDFREKANKEYADFMRLVWKSYQSLPEIPNSFSEIPFVYRFAIDGFVKGLQLG